MCFFNEQYLQIHLITQGGNMNYETHNPNVIFKRFQSFMSLLSLICKYLKMMIISTISVIRL